MQAGFPTFECSPKLAAAYMATNVHPEAAADLRMPWEAFLVDVPSGLLPMTPSVAVFRSEHYAALMKMEGNPIHLVYVLGNEKEIHGVNSTVVTSLSGLASKHIEETSFGEAPDETKRYAELVDAYILNLLLDLGEGAKIVPSGHRKAMRRGKPPKKWIFKFNKKIQVDCRPFTNAYLNGERKSPHVQTLARGHRKMQPYGPKSSLRKLIWIEPYWRGRPDAPISARVR